MVTKLKELQDLVKEVCQVKADRNIKGVYHTTDKNWFLVERKMLEGLLLTEPLCEFTDTACGKLITEKDMESQARESVKGCDTPISVLILTVKGYRKEETARILRISLDEVEDVLSITEDFDEDIRRNLIMEHSKGLYYEDVEDFLSCGGSYERYRDLLERRTPIC